MSEKIIVIFLWFLTLIAIALALVSAQSSLLAFAIFSVLAFVVAPPIRRKFGGGAAKFLFSKVTSILIVPTLFIVGLFVQIFANVDQRTLTEFRKDPSSFAASIRSMIEEGETTKAYVQLKDLFRLEKDNDLLVSLAAELTLSEFKNLSDTKKFGMLSYKLEEFKELVGNKSVSADIEAAYMSVVEEAVEHHISAEEYGMALIRIKDSEKDFPNKPEYERLTALVDNSRKAKDEEREAARLRAVEAERQQQAQARAESSREQAKKDVDAMLKQFRDNQREMAGQK